MKEEDVKNRIVIPYLQQLGFSVENLSFETFFYIKLGKHSHKIASNEEEAARGYLDLLYKVNNENIFVIETKASNHEIDQDDIDQAISYGRLLDNIAPFTIVTNGASTRVFDTITKHELKADKLSESQYCVNGYSISIDPEIRYEALLKLVDLNANTLLNFCQYQVNERIAPLKARSSNGNGQYISEIYIERAYVTNSIYEFLDDHEKKVLLITGNAGVGKTNLVCNVVEKILSSGKYALFYSSTMLSKDIDTNIVEDFNWELKQDKNIIQYIQQLSSILRRQNKELIIFVDAIDEYQRENVQIELNDFIRHIKKEPLKVILTCKYTKQNRFLFYPPGIPTPIHEAIYSKEKSSIMNDNAFLKDFNENELISAVLAYNRFFNLQIFPYENKLQKLKNPLMLRIFFETCSKGLPQDIGLISYHDVCSRYLAIILDYSDNLDLAARCLTQIAQIMLLRNTDTISSFEIDSLLIPYIKFLSDYNILTTTKDEKNRGYIFFNSDDIRKFITCYYLLKLDEVNLSQLTTIIEQNLNRVFFSEVLIWYRNEELDSNKKKLLDQKIFDHYKMLGLEMLSDYDRITNENFPFLSKEKGIILFYEDVNLKIYAYALTELRDEDEPVIFENIKNVFRIGHKYKIGSVHRTLGSLLEDISYSDAIRQHILSEVKTRIENDALDESTNYGLQTERLFDNLYSLYLSGLFPFNIFDRLPISCNDLINVIDGLISSGKPFSSTLFDVRTILKNIGRKAQNIESPLLPLGDKINSAEIRIGNQTFKDKIIYKPQYYSNLEQLRSFFQAFFESFLREYQILIENNFRMHRSNFKLYNELPCYLIGELHECDQTVYKYSIDTAILHNNLGSNEVEILIKKENSIFDLENFTVSTAKGVLNLSEHFDSDITIYFNPKGKFKLTNQIIRQYVYHFIESELRYKPLELVR